MSASTSLPIASRRIPFLPNELISQILQSSRLSKSDLARCCLVNRRFLHLSQSRLYYTVTVYFSRGESDRGESEDDWYFSDTSRLLLRTLESNVALSQKVSRVKIRSRRDQTSSGMNVTLKCAPLSKALTFVFDMLPKLVSLELERWFWERQETNNAIREYGHRWEGLHMRIAKVLTQGRRWSDLPNLKELDCAQLSRRPQYDEPIPISLEVLNINGNRPETLRGSPGSRLKFLRVVGSPETLSDIGDFPELQHLHIFRGLECQPLLPSSAFSAFSHLAHLRSLSLALWSVGDPTLTSTLPGLLAHLPHSLDRLDFPERTPIEILSAYFKLEISPPFRFLRYSLWKYQDKTEKHCSIAQLGNLAWSKGVRIECIKR